MNGKNTAHRLYPGQHVRLNIRRLGINGEGIGHAQRQVVFVDGGLPGEEVDAKITEVHDNYAVAKLLAVRRASPRRVAPPCPLYAACGGCQIQHLAYEGQLAAKMDLVRESFHRYTGLDDIPLRPIVGMEHPWSYRNKAQWQLGRINGRLAAGLYKPGTHRLVELTDCPVQHPATTRILQVTRDVLETLSIPPYDERKKTGVVRTIVVRCGFATGDAQLTLVTATEHIPSADRLIDMLRTRLPEVTGIMQNVNNKKTPLIFGERTKRLWGKPTLAEKLGHLTFHLSPRAFFQLNPVQTLKLYQYIQEAAALTGRESVVDAYCGVGTIGLWLARDAREVRGIETVPEAVEDARENARLNGIDNARFFAGKAETLLPRWIKDGFRPDVVVVDPPRSGCERPLLDALVRAKPQRLVYVSCNPSTLAKDCAVLFNGGFRLKWIQPVDMFPHTAHVETCALITRE